MLIRPRKVRRSEKFTPRFATTARRKKEQCVSYYSMAMIQLVLFFFLLLGAYKSYLAISVRASDLGLLQRMAVPGFFILAAVLILRAFVRNIMEARAIQKPTSGDENL